MSLPNECLICGRSIREVAEVEGEEGPTLSWNCDRCGTLILPHAVRTLLPTIKRFTLGMVAQDLAAYHKANPGRFVLLAPEHFGVRPN